MRLLRAMRLGVGHEMRFLDMVAFHILVGNADAHGKNFAILYHGRKAELAPVYDAVCTALYPALSRDAAMAIGGETRLDRIDRDAFVRMASEIGVAPALVLRRLDTMAARTLAAARSLRDDLSDLRPSPVFGRIAAFIESQTARLSR